MLLILVVCYTFATSRISCFFFNDTATTEIYTLSLHDALPISSERGSEAAIIDPLASAKTTLVCPSVSVCAATSVGTDRKSTRLNSSHQIISYAVFCLKKKTLPTGIVDPHFGRRGRNPRRLYSL